MGTSTRATAYRAGAVLILVAVGASAFVCVTGVMPA
jgi:hypothetical protein